MTSRRTLIANAAQAASDARDRADLDLVAPVDIYALADALGARVRFLDISMEGFYQKSVSPRILISALRPLARRAFTCAHEVGHHWFGHGSRIDELQSDNRPDSSTPDEILANGFASFVLMPTIGLRRAFNSRGWSMNDASPTQILAIASEFGVGYGTLLTHLSYTLREISTERRSQLERWTPQRVRRQMLGEQDLSGLVVLDRHQRAASVDLEVDYGIALPTRAQIQGNALELVRSYPDFELYRAARRGRVQVTTSDWHTEVRVSPKAFVGLARYRFLEDPDE